MLSWTVGAAQFAACAVRAPTGCLVVTLSRFQALIVAIWTTGAASAALVVVPGGLVPDLVGYRVGPVGQPGDGLGERQRGAFGVGEVRRLPPGRYGEEPLVGFAGLPGAAGVHVDADAAAVDLAGAQVHELDRRLRQACLPAALPSAWRAS